MEIDPSCITDETDPNNLSQWDSLSHVKLVLELEQVFNIEITPEEGIDHFINFKSIVAFIEEKLGDNLREVNQSKKTPTS